ncbi:STARD3 N-terminal-like protein isoform X2 [Brachionichthys hirsutus]|uniref:STARD3 N-terminal-like protein isoform X2 n=1 Tax=Brachionichthys hirsutus TaxID=412623 RepID=UPI00360536A5
MDTQCSSTDLWPAISGVGPIKEKSIQAGVESCEAGEKKCISDVRRTFCLFVTFDLLFIILLWIIELNVNGGIQKQLEQEVLHYDYRASFFDIFLLAVFRFATLILAYAVCKLRHWWAIAITSAVSCAFLIIKVILSKKHGCWTSRFCLRRLNMKKDTCPSWTPLSVLLSWVQGLCLMDSSTLHPSLWQILMKTWMINTTQKKGSFSR